MGRPLKIAKAQAVLTITDTAVNGTVTVSQNLTNLGITAWMNFVVATTVGGLTAGVTYYILAITGTSTFTVSSTQQSVQPQTSPTLTATSSQTVSATVNAVDMYFDNPNGPEWPATNANTYSVVGGNTAIYGSQVLCNVAFGVNGTGTVFANASSNIVVGLGTDFANLATGTLLFSTGTDGSINLLGTGTATKGNLTVALANSAANGTIGTSGNAQTLSVNTPVVFNSTFGGNIVSGTTYYVKAIANAAAFTVATTVGGATLALSANASVTGNAIQNRVVLGAASSNDASANAFVQALPEAGFIVRQKGKTKYLVTGGTTAITGAVYTANVANTALTPNTMSIIATNAASGTQYVSSLNDHSSELFPATVAPGSLVTGTLYTIYSAGTTNWTSVGAAANITGITFTATGTASGTGLAVLNTVNPDVISSFNTAAVANAANGQPNPIVTINNA